MSDERFYYARVGNERVRKAVPVYKNRPSAQSRKIGDAALKKVKDRIQSIRKPTAESLDVADKLLSALEKGPVRAIGGIVYDAEMKPVMNTTDMHSAVRALERHDILVRRQDAGGSPTWNVESKAVELVNKLLG